MRVYLQFSVDDWESLPWWQQKMYTEQLNKHKPWQQGEEREQRSEEKELPEADSGLDMFAQSGFNVQQMT